MKVKIKKIINGIYRYICYITDLKPITLLATLSRLFVYFLAIKHLLNQEYTQGILLIIINLFSTAFTVMGFVIFETNAYDKMMKNGLKRKILKEHKKTMDDLYAEDKYTKEEKIQAIEFHIQVMTEIINDLKKELDNLKK